METGNNFLIVSFHDSNNFVEPPSASSGRFNAMIGLYFGAAGNAVIVDKDGTTHTLTVAAGSWVPIRAIRINATLTTVAAGSVLAVFL